MESMDNCIQQLRELTEEILPRLDWIAYEELAEFIQRRQPLVDQISAFSQKEAISPAQKEAILSIMNFDPLIQQRMMKLKDAAGNVLTKRGNAKAQRNVYEAVYAAGSILMDKKK